MANRGVVHCGGTPRTGRSGVSTRKFDGSIAIPLLVPGRNIYLSHNFEANYGVPTNETQYFLWYQRFKDSKFNITKAIETNRRRRREEHRLGFSRTYFYGQLEERLDLYGLNATGCMQRIICEVSEVPVGVHNGVFGDVLSVIFSPSASLKEDLPNGYYEAESRGHTDGCQQYRTFLHCDNAENHPGSDVARSRQKRIVFPLNAAMGIIFALAIPLGIPSRNIFMSYNFEGNYNSPADANIFSEGFANYIKGIVEPLTAPSVPVETYGIRKRSVGEKMPKVRPTAQITRTHIYTMLQKHLQSQHLHGKKCLQRMICEASLHPFSESNGVIGDLMQILLSPVSSKDESLPKEYRIAEQAGRDGSCELYRPECPKDPLQFIICGQISNMDKLSVCFLVLVSPLVLPFAGTQNATDPADEGRFLIRGKPILIYPPTAPTRHQLIVGIGVPVQEIPHSVVFGWVLKAQYYLPTVTQNYDPINLENWNESRRAFPDRSRRSVERYEVDNVRIRVEPLPVQADTGNSYDEWFEQDTPGEASEKPGPEPESEKPEENNTSGGRPDGYNVPDGRWMLYKAIEGLSTGYGYGGRACMLRSICEAAEAQFTHTGGVYAELLHIMFSPSTTTEAVSEHRDNEYYRAEQLGRSGAPCATIFRECSTSILDMFSGVHDIHQATSSSMFLRIVLGCVVLLPLVSADFIPWLIVPETAPTRHQLISGIGIPVGTPESITSGWVMKAQYFLPTKVDDLKPELWENWNDSRRALSRRDVSGAQVPVPIAHLPAGGASYERYEVGNVPIQEESLGSVEADTSDEQFDDGDDSYWTDEEDTQILQKADRGGLWPAPKEIDPSLLAGYSAEQSRWTTYKAMEKLSENYGLPGRACVLRSVCESAAAPFTHTGGIFAELLHIVFSPSTTAEPLSEHRDNEYFRAEQLGRTGAPCERIFPECVHSLLDVFTGVHDPETGTMHLLHDEVRAYLMRK
uniref:Uncharacterized protein n=1 Tax=Anopheles dirus TaxID=7168 RepID=A0A182N6E6_9DIPT